MSFAAKLLHCVDCHENFTFSVEEQEFHASRGFPNQPGRCPPCRQAKKSGRTKNESVSEDSGSSRQMFPANCSQCGKATRLPFQPRENESVYCSNCYTKTRVAR